MSNSLDSDQAQHFVGPDLGPNCLQRLSADDTKDLNMIAQFLSLSFGPTLYLPPEGSGEAVHLPRLFWAFAVGINNEKNILWAGLMFFAVFCGGGGGGGGVQIKNGIFLLFFHFNAWIAKSVISKLYGRCFKFWTLVAC